MGRSRSAAGRGVKLYLVDRGGDVTYHGPGQLVGVPLLKLAADGLLPDPASEKPRLPQADYVGYVRRLEQALIMALARRALPPSRSKARPASGWTAPALSTLDTPYAKIAAIGIKVDARGVPRHGFALNVDPDMSYWQGIIACGLVGYPVTSLAEISSPPPDMQAVIAAVVNAFARTYDFQMTAEVL